MSTSPTTEQDPSSGPVSKDLIVALDEAPPFETILTVNETRYRLGWGSTTWPDSTVTLFTVADVEPGETDLAGILTYGTHVHGTDSEPAAYVRTPPTTDASTEPDSPVRTPVTSISVDEAHPLEDLQSALDTIHARVPEGKRTLPEELAFTKYLHELRTADAHPVHEAVAGAAKIHRSLLEWQESAHEFLFRVENAIDGTTRSDTTGGLPAPVSLWGVHDAVVSFADRLSDPDSDLRAYYEAKDMPRNR